MRLADRHIHLALTEEARTHMVKADYDPAKSELMFQPLPVLV
jgi:hypothetical protein